MKNKFRAEKNWWLASSCFSLWASAWRLTVLQESGLLQPWIPPRIQWRLRSRGAWFCLAIVILLVGDLPLSRVNYWFQISSSITPNKLELSDRHADACKDVQWGNCKNGKKELCSARCQDFCQSVHLLAEERQRVLFWVRDSHLTGKWGAEIFDGIRNVEQTSDRIDGLFASKTCLQVLQSVDKSNFMINVLCMGCGVVVVFLCLWALAHVLEGFGGPAIPIPPASAPPKED